MGGEKTNARGTKNGRVPVREVDVLAVGEAPREGRVTELALLALLELVQQDEVARDLNATHCCSVRVCTGSGESLYGVCGVCGTNCLYEGVVCECVYVFKTTLNNQSLTPKKERKNGYWFPIAFLETVCSHDVNLSLDFTPRVVCFLMSHLSISPSCLVYLGIHK